MATEIQQSNDLKLQKSILGSGTLRQHLFRGEFTNEAAFLVV